MEDNRLNIDTKALVPQNTNPIYELIRRIRALYINKIRPLFGAKDIQQRIVTIPQDIMNKLQREYIGIGREKIVNERDKEVFKKYSKELKAEPKIGQDEMEVQIKGGTISVEKIKDAIREFNKGIKK